MCVGGAESYQDEIVFEEQEIKLLRQDFNHLNYTQSKQINVTMILGFARVRELIEN